MSENFFKKLSQIGMKNLKNIDLKTFTTNLKNNRHALIHVVFVGMTLLVTTYVWQVYKKDSLELKKQIQEITERVNVVEEQKKIIKEYEQLRGNFPKAVSTDELINQLSDSAVKLNVQMTSLSPVQESSDEFIEISHFDMYVVSKDYQNIVDFTQRIENSPHAVRLKEWSGEMQSTIGAKIVMESLRLKK